MSLFLGDGSTSFNTSSLLQATLSISVSQKQTENNKNTLKPLLIDRRVSSSARSSAKHASSRSNRLAEPMAPTRNDRIGGTSMPADGIEMIRQVAH